MPTPEIVSLADAKLFLHVEDDGEDATIELLIEAATEAALAYADALPEETTDYPARVKLSILSHVAQAFSNRESGSDAPASNARLMQPLRDLEI